MESKNFLLVENLQSGYANKFVIRDINFAISKGSFTGIIGPNGSGKTTLFKTITGELSLMKGSVYLNKNYISTMQPKQKARKIAIVTQTTDAVDISVEDYVLMGRYPYKKKFQLFDTVEDLKLAHKFMKLTGVLRFKDKLMNELSGGEQQLVAIAKALAQEPELLLLDEPTSHLDISHQMQVLNLIQKLNEDYNLTVLMIIHDLNLAAEFCDFLMMMDQGKIYVKGTPEEVLTYKNIEEVFKAIVITQENRITKKPSILLVSDKTYKQI